MQSPGGGDGGAAGGNETVVEEIFDILKNVFPGVTIPDIGSCEVQVTAWCVKDSHTVVLV